MIDLITSKIAMMVAAAIILTTVLGVYAVQRDQGRDMELRHTAETVCRAVDDLNSVHGETRLNITFDIEVEGRYLKPTVNGMNYDIILTIHEVIISQEGRIYQEDFLAPVHLWEPETSSFTQSEIADRDLECEELRFKSGTDFTLERMRTAVDGENRFMTFVYVQ